LTSQCFRALGNERLAVVLDDIKSIGFKNASKSGVSIAINDVIVSPRKSEIVAKAEDAVIQLEDQYQDGLITDEEKYTATVKIWTDSNDELTQVIADDLPNYGGIYMMANSGAKGNIAQIKQMAGMRGLMSNPRGRIIDRPIKSNFREGLTVLEYFISTHGARKGLADTALRTADSGYLTRRLIDVAQEVIVMEEDCNADQGLLITDYQDEALSDLFFDRIKYRYVAAPVSNPKTGEIIFESNHLIEEDDITAIKESGVTSAEVRSPLTCEAEKGLCRLCYGLSLANLQPIMIGDAVGIIAAQSIGEPGTQLTMRTFHTGGISGSVRSGEDKIYNISGVEEYPLRDTSTPGIITEYTPLIKEGEAVNIGTPIVQLKGAEEEEDDGIIHARDYGIASMGVVFPDKDLEQAIRDELDKQQGVLTRADLKRLKKLETREKLEDYKNEIKEDKIAVTGLAYTSLIKEGEAVNVGARIAQRKAVKGDDGIISAGNSGIANIEKGRITIAGVAVKRDITGVLAGSLELGGLPRVEELFEARSPKGAAVLSEISGTAEIIHSNEGRTVRILNSEELADEYTISGYTPLIKKGDTVIIGTPIAKLKGAEEEEDDGIIHARNSGLANIKKGTITITWTDEERREYPVPAASHIEISDGDFIEAGQGITSGPKNPQQILEIQGREAVQTYLIEEVQKVYRSQGVPIHDKHIEAIIRQMLRRVQVNEAGDTDFLPGDPMGRREFEEKNAEIIAEGGDPATAVPILLGITRASLHMDSFLAAASFQETTRVLTESAVMGKRDMLTGLKENVIIGRLIPARYDNTIEGKEKLGLNELEELLELEDIPDSPPPPEFEDKEGNIIPVTQFKANPKEEMEEIPGD
jgi:DNA-directed RNA polymerase subunit beta'